MYFAVDKTVKTSRLIFWRQCCLKALDPNIFIKQTGENILARPATSNWGQPSFTVLKLQVSEAAKPHLTGSIFCWQDCRILLGVFDCLRETSSFETFLTSQKTAESKWHNKWGSLFWVLIPNYQWLLRGGLTFAILMIICPIYLMPWQCPVLVGKPNSKEGTVLSKHWGIVHNTYSCSRPVLLPLSLPCIIFNCAIVCAELFIQLLYNLKVVSFIECQAD